MVALYLSMVDPVGETADNFISLQIYICATQEDWTFQRLVSKTRLSSFDHFLCSYNVMFTERSSHQTCMQSVCRRVLFFQMD